MLEPVSNPYKKGKSKLIADLMLEEWSNEKIYNHITDNKLDERFSHPVTMDNIYQVRTRFNQKGITDKMKELKEEQERTVVTPEEELRKTPEDDGSPRVLYDSKLQGEVVDSNEKIIGKYPPVGRPEWDLLTTDQINKIEDPKTRTLILDYRSYREKIKQEITPDYATSARISFHRFLGFPSVIPDATTVWLRAPYHWFRRRSRYGLYPSSEGQLQPALLRAGLYTR